MRQGSRCQEAPGPGEVQHHLPAVWPTSLSAPAAVRAGRGDRVSVTVDHRPVCGAAVPERRNPADCGRSLMASNSPFCNRCVPCSLFPGLGGPPGRPLSVSWTCSSAMTDTVPRSMPDVYIGRYRFSGRADAKSSVLDLPPHRRAGPASTLHLSGPHRPPLSPKRGARRLDQLGIPAFRVKRGCRFRI
jgi:hypothetical protein